MVLKITVPENLNFQGMFDEILNRHTSSWSLKSVKTSDFGTLFEVAYHITLKPGADQKVFLDELRCCNGNLKIALTVKEYEDMIRILQE
jgi:predicted SnoaL-like aldol condensation-catalyzing enzyme